MEDGRRLFAELWASQSIEKVHLCATQLPTAQVDPLRIDAESDRASVTFRYEGCGYAISDAQYEYFLFVDDPNCNDEILLLVAQHFNALLRQVTTWTELIEVSSEPRKDSES